MRKYLNTVIDTAGNALSGASVTIYDTGTEDKPTIYSDEGSTPISNPITTGADGLFEFYVADGDYDIKITKTGYDTQNWNDLTIGSSFSGSSPTVLLTNTTTEDADGGRESQIVAKGIQSGAEKTTLAKIEFSHDGASDDEKGQVKIYVNDGDDSDSPSLTLTIDSAKLATFVGNIIANSFSDGTATLTGGVGTGFTLTTPTIGDLTNATHDHADAAGGGTAIGATAVLADGVTATTQSGTDDSTKVATTAHVKDVKLDDFATPDDNTDLDASPSQHGLLPKTPNVATSFLNGQGGWTKPGFKSYTKAHWSNMTGYGSTATKIPYFGTELVASDDSVVTITNDSTNGFTITANKNCLIFVGLSLDLTTAQYIGLSINATHTTDFTSLAAANRLDFGYLDSANHHKKVSWFGYLTTNDVIRPHTNAVARGTNYAFSNINILAIEL